MGWDADAKYANGKTIPRRWQKVSRINNRRLRKAFEDAERQARECSGGSVDWLLPLAGLDCSSAAVALEQISGLSAWDESGWSADEVNGAWKTAQEWFSCKPEPGHEAWAWCSAWFFLKTCAEQGLSVEFSW